MSSFSENSHGQKAETSARPYDTLKDIYFAENKILKTLPKMAKAAQSRELRAAFTKHERETRGQVKRLDRVFKIIGKPSRGKTCAAINGIAKALRS